ncbi:amidohydrolase family protein [Streptomyces sp. NPDC052036]|uniref:amidohydrolase family protein n=1 Tax=Streptomyces sp. NPDC052036 TaxID=3155171 RepID=UPI00343BEBC2
MLIRAARVFDGVRLIDADSVLVRDGLIVEVGSRRALPRGVRIVAGRSGTLLPGLIDSHTHALRIENLVEALAFGVTTELDMFCVPPHAQRLRHAAANRSDLADFRSAGIGAAAPGGPPTHLVKRGLYPPFPTLSGPREAESFVAARVAEGADYVKVFAGARGGGTGAAPKHAALSEESVRAVVAAAHTHGKKVFVHAEGGAAVRMALDAGADALAHHPEATDLTADLLGRLSERGRFVIPTVSATAGFVPTAPSSAARAPSPERDLYVDGVLRLTNAMHRAGVPLLAGSDAIPVFGHGIGLHRELELLVEAGLTPAQALAAATSVPAACVGLTDRGRIATGLRADLLLVDGDPTRDIAATRALRAVWRAGVETGPATFRARRRIEVLAPGGLWAAVDR